MKDAIKKSLLAGLGAIDFSVEKVREAVDRLVERGELTAGQGKKVVEELVERGKKDSAELGKKIDRGVRGALEKITVITRPHFDKLAARVAELEAKVAVIEQQAVEPATGGAPQESGEESGAG